MPRRISAGGARYVENKKTRNTIPGLAGTTEEKLQNILRL